MRELSRPVAIVAAVIMTLGGCSLINQPPGRAERAPVSRETLAEIKLVVKGVEHEVAAFVPESLTAGSVESGGGSITDCAPGGVSWGSNTSVPVSSQPDYDDFTNELKEHWSRADEFDFELTEGSTGEPRLILRSPTLGNYYVERIQEFVQVASFSPCFAYDAERDGYAWEIAAE
jgi:hypothetical protein